ncbi:MAG: hypothetical protein JRJ66_09765, partial [Deltaproteobacteria bacterium]|nr:hypothetical protein [Deltaproteobacteria bacterium]
PSFEKEYTIVTTRLPHIEKNLARQVAHFMQKIRSVDFLKRPGISETLDWASALIEMERKHLDEEVVKETLGWMHSKIPGRYKKIYRGNMG